MSPGYTYSPMRLLACVALLDHLLAYDQAPFVVRVAHNFPPRGFMPGGVEWHGADAVRVLLIIPPDMEYVATAPTSDLRAGPAVGLRATLDGMNTSTSPVRVDITTSTAEALRSYERYDVLWDIRGVLVKEHLAEVANGGGPRLAPGAVRRIVVRWHARSAIRILRPRNPAAPNVRKGHGNLHCYTAGSERLLYRVQALPIERSGGELASRCGTGPR